MNRCHIRTKQNKMQNHYSEMLKFTLFEFQLVSNKEKKAKQRKQNE